MTNLKTLTTRGSTIFRNLQLGNHLFAMMNLQLPLEWCPASVPGVIAGKDRGMEISTTTRARLKTRWSDDHGQHELTLPLCWQAKQLLICCLLCALNKHPSINKKNVVGHGDCLWWHRLVDPPTGDGQSHHTLAWGHVGAGIVSRKCVVTYDPWMHWNCHHG